MNWIFFNSGANDGKFNMDLDLQLAKNIDHQSAVLRIYRWDPFCISLGANQSFDEINIEKTKSDGIEVIKRPTGGRAILHSEELTYSVVYPIDATGSTKTIYNEINLALKMGLTLFDEKLDMIELEHSQPNFKEFYKTDLSSICFAVSAKSELNFRGKKIVGSAQRKIGNVILQHGSILCGNYHTKIIDYLNVNNTQKTMMLNEINTTTIDLKTALNYEIEYSKLNQSILKGFEKYFNAKFELQKNFHFKSHKYREAGFVR